MHLQLSYVYYSVLFFLSICSVFVVVEAHVRSYGLPRLDQPTSQTQNGSGHYLRPGAKERVSRNSTTNAADNPSHSGAQDAIDERSKEFARVLYFAFTERNVHEAQPFKFFSDWTMEARERYIEATKAQNDLRLTEFFAYDTLGWKDMKCAKSFRGCIKVPPMDVIRQKYPNDRNRARQIYFMLKYSTLMYKQAASVLGGLNGAKEDMEKQCESFAKDFFHPKEEKSDAKCIVMITLGIIGAIGAMAGIGEAVWAGTLGWIATNGLGEGISDAVAVALPESFAIEGAATAEAASVAPEAEVISEVEGPLAAEGGNVLQNGLRAQLKDVGLAPPSEASVSYATQMKDLWNMGYSRSEISSIMDGIHGESENLIAAKDIVTLLDSWFDEPMTGWKAKRAESKSMVTIGTIDEVFLQGPVASPAQAAEKLKGDVASAPVKLGLVGYGTWTDANNETIAQAANNTDPNSLRRFNPVLDMEIEKERFDVIKTHLLDIEKYYNQLRDPSFDESSPVSPKIQRDHTNGTSKNPRSIFVRPRHLSWVSMAGKHQFNGADPNPTEQGMPSRLLFKFSPNSPKSARDLSERDEQDRLAFMKNLAAYDALALANHLSAFQLGDIITDQMIEKRTTNKSEWLAAQSGRLDDDFTVNMNFSIFHNDIKRKFCDGKVYTGKTKDNERACKDVTDFVMQDTIERVQKSISGADSPGPLKSNDGWKNGEPAPLATHLEARFSVFPNIDKIVLYDNHPDVLRKRILRSLQNNMISKAWADQQCYIGCGQENWQTLEGIGWFDVRKIPTPNSTQFQTTACLSSCYEPLKRKHVTLYGFQNGAAMKDPWSLNLTNIQYISLAEYNARTQDSTYLPGSFAINPFNRTIEDYVPILPVCKSDALIVKSPESKHDYFPCTCGNMYGNESLQFWKAFDWKALPNMQHAIGDCRKALEFQLRSDPVAYLINLCQVFYTAIHPPGSEEAVSNKAGWKENYHSCELVLQYYQEHKNDPEEELNHQIGIIWGKYHKGGDGSYSFGTVNHDLATRAFSKYAPLNIMKEGGLAPGWV